MELIRDSYKLVHGEDAPANILEKWSMRESAAARRVGTTHLLPILEIKLYISHRMSFDWVLLLVQEDCHLPLAALLCFTGISTA